MGNTKEEILLVSLHLFAQDGYEAVSVSQIAGELGITKGALYRHYQSKRDIFDHILACMEQGAGEQAESHDMPQERKEDAPETYQELSFVDFMAYSQSMFAYWTEDDFASSFRKMLTLEQFRNAEMQELYQQYLVSGPVAYVKDLFESMKFDSVLEKAVQFYATMFFFYSMYDWAEDKEQVKLEFETSLRKIAEELYENEQAVEEKVTERNGK